MAVSGLNGTRFLVIVMLGDSSPSRLQTLVPRLQEVLAALSTEPTQQAFRSATADIFGYFLRSTLRAGQLLGRLETPDPPPFLDNADSLLILEIGEDISAIGRSNTWRWLQHH
jgi:hypothetical protein